MAQRSDETDMRLASDLHRRGRFVDAERVYRRILQRQPDHVDATHMLGVLAGQTRRAVQAVELFRRTIQLKPDFAPAHYHLGNALQESDRIEEATGAYSKAIELSPGFVEALVNLAQANLRLGRLDETIVACRKAIEINPNLARPFLYLGTVLQARGQIDDAIAAYRNSIRLAPKDAQAYSHLGAALTKKGQPDEAITVLKKAMELRPDLPQAHTNASVAYKDCGQLDEAIACCRRAMELRPQSAIAHSNLIVLQNYHPDYTAKMLLEETLRWAQRHAEPLAKNIQPHLNDRSPRHRLKIGYVSADINIHPVGRFLLPLLVHHNRENVEIHCYSDTQQIDPITAQARSASDHWHDTAGLTDQDLAENIRADRIDILVDLSLHTGSRLLLFARKPAPVQASWLGYPGTTGLRTIDYRLSDSFIDPIGQTESDYVEQTIRIPSYWCYQPLQPSPVVGRLPVEKNGHITFGCLSNFSKVSSTALEMWTGVLNAISDSWLILTSNSGQHRDRIKQWFASHGVDPHRVHFVDRLPVLEYMAKYNEIDIALDTAPFAGGTTTCDALWMGVPVVTLSGKTAVGRSGVSLLSNVGLPVLIAKSPQEYIEIAASLAKELPKLTELRSGLREKMQGSSLMDIRRFTAGIEAAYRQMWVAKP